MKAVENATMINQVYPKHFRFIIQSDYTPALYFHSRITWPCKFEMQSFLFG